MSEPRGARRTWAARAAVLVLAVVSPIMAARLENDDNLLAFLPKTNPDVKTFYEVNDRFGPVIDVQVPAEDGAGLAWLYRHGEVLSRSDDAAGSHLKVRLSTGDAARFARRESDGREPAVAAPKGAAVR